MSNPLSQPNDSAAPQYASEVFYDGLTTFWVPIADGSFERSADEAAKLAASLDGPFQDYCHVDRVSGRVEETAEGPHFHPEAEGEFECWQVDAQ